MYKFESSHALVNAVYDAFSIDGWKNGLSFFGEYVVVSDPNGDHKELIHVTFKGCPCVETISHFEKNPWDIFHGLDLTLEIHCSKELAELAVKGLVLLMKQKLSQVHWVSVEK